MAESDDKLSRGYRGLAREEPPAALDAAILAAAREAVRPRKRNQWAGPVSIAAVLVLGIGVSLRMQLEQPGVETSMPAPAQAPAAPTASPPVPEPVVPASVEPAAKDLAVEKNVAAAPAVRAQPPLAKLSRPAPAEEQAPAQANRPKEQDSAPADPLAKNRGDAPAEPPRAEARPFAESRASAPAAPSPPPAPPMAQSIAPATPPAPAAASPVPLRMKREAAAGAIVQDSAARADADERTTELERVARLRRDGRDAEADKALEEFRRRNPDYRIPEAMWERVRPR